jgi:hypothetical protein
MRTIRFPEEVDRELRDVAHSERSSVNRTVVVAVERYIRSWKGRQGRLRGAPGAQPREEATDGR